MNSIYYIVMLLVFECFAVLYLYFRDEYNTLVLKSEW